MKTLNKKFIYLISPNKIINNSFYNILNQVFKSKKVKFFQLRLKKGSIKKKVIIAKKILQICKKNKVKLIINDDPNLALKVNAHGCHLGQKDMNIFDARKILKNKIIGVTCHNSIKLAKIALSGGADYIASPQTATLTFTSSLAVNDKVVVITVENQAQKTIAGLMFEDEYTNAQGFINFSKLNIANNEIPQNKVNQLSTSLANKANISSSINQPAGAQTGDLWLDTSQVPNI